MDCYLIAISQPTVLSGLFAGMLSYQLVPALVSAEKRFGSAAPLLRSLTVGVGCSTCALALVCVLFAEPLVSWLYGGFSPEQIQLTVQLTRVAWLWLPLAVTSAIYTAGLHLRHEFAVATSAASLPIIGATIGCVLGHSRYGIYAAAVGQLAGYAAMLLCLRAKIPSTGKGWDWEGLRELRRQMPFAMSAILVFVIYPLSDAIWASRVGPAAVSYLGYAQRLVVGLASLAIVGATTVMFPRLARLGGEGAIESLRENLATGLRVILLCVCPVAVILSIAALPSLQVLFQRGSFTFQDAQAVAGILPLMLVGMVAMSCMGIMFKAFFAVKKLGQAAAISLGGSLLYFLLSGGLGSALGLTGIGVAYAVSWWAVLLVSIGVLWGRPLWHLAGRTTVSFAISLAGATFVAMIIAWLGCFLLPPEGSNNQMTRLLLLTGVATFALAAFATTAYLEGMSEVRFAVQRGREKIKFFR
jgi:putative peptidoglycan lipid II flippase